MTLTSRPRLYLCCPTRCNPEYFYFAVIYMLGSFVKLYLKGILLKKVSGSFISVHLPTPIALITSLKLVWSFTRISERPKKKKIRKTEVTGL